MSRTGKWIYDWSDDDFRDAWREMQGESVIYGLLAAGVLAIPMFGAGVPALDAIAMCVLGGAFFGGVCWMSGHDSIARWRRLRDEFAPREEPKP